MNRGNDPHAVIAPRFPLWIANQGLELEVVAARRGRSSPSSGSKRPSLSGQAFKCCVAAGCDGPVGVT